LLLYNAWDAGSAQSVLEAGAGASGFFIPGLTEGALIGQLCEAVTLPVNIMVMDGVPSNERLAKLNVARIRYKRAQRLQK
jgi:2-methylisocitrate lyase-like PEP mutase family enzyme